MAGALTAAITISLTVYAFTTKTDFTVCGGFLFICVTALIVASIIAIFIRNRWLNLAISVIGVIIFGLYLIFDT